MKQNRIAYLLLLLLCGFVHAKPWSSISTGLDMSTVYWEQGSHTAWSFQTAFGPRIIDDLYFRVKISIPIPFFIVIGNQINAGGEFSYLLKNPQEGFAIETSLGAGWTATWPKDIIVILADGESTTTPKEEDFDGAQGIRLEVLTSFGYKSDWGAVWLDLGLDHRRMDVRRFVNGNREDSFHTFTGPHIGISADLFFGD